MVDCDDTPFVVHTRMYQCSGRDRHAKWSLKAGTPDNFETTLVVAGCVRGVVAEEGYVQYKFRWYQAKLVVNKGGRSQGCSSKRGTTVYSTHILLQMIKVDCDFSWFTVIQQG